MGTVSPTAPPTSDGSPEPTPQPQEVRRLSFKMQLTMNIHEQAIAMRPLGNKQEVIDGVYPACWGYASQDLRVLCRSTMCSMMRTMIQAIANSIASTIHLTMEKQVGVACRA